MSALQTVHVRVNDAATGEPTPVRLRITDAGGRYYAPFGRLTKFSIDNGDNVGGNLLLGKEACAYIDGTCEIQLPPGRLTVAIDKGPEYRPIRDEVALAAGQLSLRFVVERWINLREARWFPGDVSCFFLTPHAALLEGAAEDLAVVNLLCREFNRSGDDDTYREYPNLLAFSGQKPALETNGLQVVVNTMNAHPRLGILLLLNCHRVVFPLRFGDPSGFDNWTLADWCDQCHRKGGLVLGSCFSGNPYGEVLADLLLGKVDALVLDSLEAPRIAMAAGAAAQLQQWQWLLDCGFRVPLVAGSWKMANYLPLGDRRTYARLQPGQDFTYKNWIDAVRAGRTFVTDGPLLFFTVNGQDPGAVLDLPAEAATVHVRAEARHLGALQGLEVVANGGVVARAQRADSRNHLAIETAVAVPAGGWLAARCWGRNYQHPDLSEAAQTSPVYVQVQGRRPPVNQQALTAFRGCLDQMLEWVAREGRFENEQQRERLAGIFQAAREVLVKRASTSV